MRAAPVATAVVSQRPFSVRARHMLGKYRRRAHVRLRLLQSVSQILPIGMFGAGRALLLRLAGARIAAGSELVGTAHVHGVRFSCSSLVVERGVQIGPHCSIDLSATVEIQEVAQIGHHVVIITADHELGPAQGRCGPITPRPVIIGRGSWIGARVTILPGVTVGPGSVISAGSTVYHDVPANTMVAGAPARAIRRLE